MQQFHADQGLLVAWGGFHSTVRVEASASFFTVRLWDSSDLLDALLDSYERLPEAVRAAIPLKRVWLVDKED